ncbi:MAG: hypothetical protein GY796_08610 [Chloroflexi bacterium]|nr:hypothetical protein [Chloroflexota bacterium]
MVRDVIPQLMQIVCGLEERVVRGELSSWLDMYTAVSQAFSPAIMTDIETRIPGWEQMAAYDNGQTRIHICSVYLAMFVTDFYQQASEHDRALWHWIVLLHDLAKKAQDGKRDRTHAFRSAVLAAQILPAVGFATLSEYEAIVDEWVVMLDTAVLPTSGDEIQDNSKLPLIVAGIERMFEVGTPADLILKTILFHHSFSPVSAWPNPAPLTDAEIKRWISPRLWQILGPFLFFDSDAWDMYFDSQIRRKQQQEVRACIHTVTIVVNLRPRRFPK